MMRAFLCGVMCGLGLAGWSLYLPAAPAKPPVQSLELEEEQLDSEALDSWGVDDVQVF